MVVPVVLGTGYREGPSTWSMRTCISNIDEFLLYSYLQDSKFQCTVCLVFTPRQPVPLKPALQVPAEAL